MSTIYYMFFNIIVMVYGDLIKYDNLATELTGI